MDTIITDLLYKGNKFNQSYIDYIDQNTPLYWDKTYNMFTYEMDLDRNANPEELAKELFKEYNPAHYDGFEAYVYDWFFENNLDYEMELRNEFIDFTIQYLQSLGVDNKEVLEFDNFLDFSNDYVQISYTPLVEEIMETELYVYIMLDTKYDLNSEGVNNVLPIDGTLTLKHLTQRGSSWEFFLKSQGINPNNFVKYVNSLCMVGRCRTDKDFLGTVYNELREFGLNSACFITFLGTCTTKQFTNIFFGQQKTLTISKNCMCGLFNPVHGSGSVLGIDLVKDIKVPSSKCLIQMDDCSTYGYDIQDVYGLHYSAFEKGNIY